MAQTERERPVLLAGGRSVVLAGLYTLLAFILCYILYEGVRGYRAKYRSADIDHAHYGRRITVGASQDDVRRLLGEPDTITFRSENATVKQVWNYTPYESPFFGQRSSAFVTFDGAAVVTIEYKVRQ